MWVLVIWICGTMCDITVVPGIYENVDACEAAVAKLDNRSDLFARYPASAACIPAPDYVTYE